MPGKHRGGRRSWRRRVPGVLVAVLAAASAAGVVTAALQGSGDQTAAAGALGAAATLTGGGVARSRAHRGHHRVASANPPPMSLLTDEQLQPSVAVAVAMSLPPLPAGTSLGAPSAATLSADDVAAWSASSFWTPPEGARMVPPVGPVMLRDGDAGTPWPPLSLVRMPLDPDEDDIDPMVDTVPHPVVKLFPLAALEPDRAAGSIDDRVYAAFETERRHAQAAAMAGRHVASGPAAAPRNPAYKSRHSA